MNIKLATSMICLLLMFPCVANADIAIIAHPSLDINHLNHEEASNLFLGKVKTTKNGTIPLLYDLPDKNKIKASFYQRLTNRNPAQLHSYWARKLFSGQATFIPIKLSSTAEMLMMISSTKNAIGYLPTNNLNDNVKVLLIIKE